MLHWGLCRLVFNRRVAAAIGAAALALGWSGIARAEITIGLLFPLTGDLQSVGADNANGALLAIEEINAQGGVLGQRLAVAVGDTQTRPQAGVDAAQKLVSLEGAVALVGANSSGVTIPIAASVSKVYGVVQISHASTSPMITGLADDDFLFRTVPSDRFQGIALAEVVNESGYRNVGILYINNDYGEGLAKSFEEAFARRGGEVSASFAYEPGNASYRGELAAAARRGAEALALIGYPENGITILRQALEAGYFSRFIFTDGIKSREIIDAIGPYLEGSIGTNPQALSDSAPARHFAEAYAARYGKPAEAPFCDTAYDAVYLIALALEKAGRVERKALRDSLRAVANPPGLKVVPGEWAKAKALIASGEEVDFVGAAGDHNFDAAGDVEGSFAFWRIENGAFVTLKVFKPGS